MPQVNKQDWFASLPPKKQKAVTIVAVVSIIIGLMLTSTLAVLIVLSQSRQYQSGSGAYPPRPSVITRDEFRNAVIGKTKEQILERFGKPDETADSSNDIQAYWYYRRATVDPLNGKVDSSVSVRINKETGLCVSVSF